MKTDYKSLTKNEFMDTYNIKAMYGLGKKTIESLHKHYEKESKENGYSYYTFDSFLKDMKAVKKAILNRKILLVTKKTTSSSSTFGLYIYGKTTPIYLNRYILKLVSGKYDDSNNTITVMACGTDRRVIAILALGYAVGLDFHKIEQSQLFL